MINDLQMTNTPTDLQSVSSILKEDLRTFADDNSRDEHDCIQVSLLSDEVKVFFKKGFKFFSYQDFLSIIQSKILRDNPVESETAEIILPPSNMFFMWKSKSEINLSCYYPSAVRNLIYETKTLDILVPNIIISHTLNLSDSDWIISSSKYFCTDLAVGALSKSEFIYQTNSSNRIFLMPMSNTYSEGKMCFGGNTMPSRFTEGNFRGLDWYFKYLWETPFNNDLGIRSLKRDIGVKEWYNLLGDLATKQMNGEKVSFPYQLLK